MTQRSAPTFGDSAIHNGNNNIDRDQPDYGYVDDFLTPPEPDPDSATLFDEQTYDKPDESLLTAAPRSAKAKEYERKLRHTLRTATIVTAGNPVTVADAAQLLLHGPTIAMHGGDLAAADPRVARAVDFITEHGDSPLTAFLSATIPTVLQIARNHEQGMDVIAERGIKIPGTTRRFKLRLPIKLKLWHRVRGFTNDPQALKEYVFTRPEIAQALKQQGIYVAGYTER